MNCPELRIHALYVRDRILFITPSLTASTFEAHWMAGLSIRSAPWCRTQR